MSARRKALKASSSSSEGGVMPSRAAAPGASIGLERRTRSTSWATATTCPQVGQRSSQRTSLTRSARNCSSSALRRDEVDLHLSTMVEQPFGLVPDRVELTQDRTHLFAEIGAGATLRGEPSGGFLGNQHVCSAPQRSGPRTAFRCRTTCRPIRSDLKTSGRRSPGSPAAWWPRRLGWADRFTRTVAATARPSAAGRRCSWPWSRPWSGSVSASTGGRDTGSHRRARRRDP